MEFLWSTHAYRDSCHLPPPWGTPPNTAIWLGIAVLALALFINYFSDPEFCALWIRGRRIRLKYRLLQFRYLRLKIFHAGLKLLGVLRLGNLSPILCRLYFGSNGIKRIHAQINADREGNCQ